MSANKHKPGAPPLQLKPGETLSDVAQRPRISPLGTPGARDSGKYAERPSRIAERHPRVSEGIATAASSPTTVAETPSSPARPFSASELRTLREGGFEEASPPGQALEASRRALDQLQAESWTLARAAAFLHESEHQLLRRIASKTLYAFQMGGYWRIPRFQFIDGQVVQGIGKVARTLSPDLSPLVVSGWFNRPNDELTDSDERPMSPLQWLLKGLDPGRVVELAAQLGTGT